MSYKLLISDGLIPIFIVPENIGDDVFDLVFVLVKDVDQRLDNLRFLKKSIEIPVVGLEGVEHVLPHLVG